MNTTGNVSSLWKPLSGIILVLLVGCTTTTQMVAAKPVPPVVLTEPPPNGDFQIRLLDFFGKKPEGQMN